MTDRLRLLHVVDSLQLGGTEGQCVSLVEQLDRARFESHVVTFNGGGPLAATLQAAGVRPHVIAFRGLRRASSVNSVVRLARFMRRHRIHVVQAYGYYSNVPAILAGRIARVPVLLASRRDMGEFMTAAQRRIERTIFRLADRVIVNADAIRGELLASGQVAGTKIVLVPNGVDVSRFDDLDHTGRPPEWSGHGKVVAMVAMFREAKDHTTFLRAASLVFAKDPTVIFVLAGGVFPGSAVCLALRTAAERLTAELGISSAVRFLGAIERGALPALLRYVDVAVLASTKCEGRPNVVLEYMAAGKPVVVTDAGGCREIVLDGTTGFVVPPTQPDLLADRILRLLHGGDAGTMGRAARRLVEREFSLARMSERFSSLYAELARQKRSRRLAVA
jgi:glycosyltransferase involved in cell wall biosynthesis